jgi:hypothetical protein
MHACSWAQYYGSTSLFTVQHLVSALWLVVFSTTISFFALVFFAPQGRLDPPAQKSDPLHKRVWSLMLHTTHELQVRSHEFAKWSYTKGTSEAVLLPIVMLYTVYIMWTLAVRWFAGYTTVELHPAQVHIVIICSYYAGTCGGQMLPCDQ